MPNKLTKDEFIKRSKKKHGDEYDYSLVEYINNRIKVKIICKKHGIFEQNPFSHTSGGGCINCSIFSLDTEKIKERFIEKYGDLYDYSEVQYIQCDKSLKIICKLHGPFYKTYTNHLHGNQGCPICSEERKKMPQSEFINRSISFNDHKYDYSNVNYINALTKVEIICKIHGSFFQTPNSHLNGHQCPKCSDPRKSIEKTIQEFKNTHGNYYDYSKVIYKNNFTKITIICPKHGEFRQKPYSHKLGSGCPICKSSHGERKIREWLIKNNIKFIRQKTFSDCRGTLWNLSFDFYLIDYNCCIEYDGSQHFKSFKCFGGNVSFRRTQRNDKIKNKYCLKHSIKLIRIKYTKFEKIEQILENKIFIDLKK